MWAVALVLQASAAVPYWRDPRVHNLGNAGIGGGIHAAMAPLATHVIDRIAYGGVDVRKRVLAEHTRPGDDVVDFGCGTGFSTAASCTGVDTSAEMLGIAQRVHPRKTFVSGNAETWGLPASKDVVTVMFVLHERRSRPRTARATRGPSWPPLTCSGENERSRRRRCVC